MYIITISDNTPLPIVVNTLNLVKALTKYPIPDAAATVKAYGI